MADGEARAATDYGLVAMEALKEIAQHPDTPVTARVAAAKALADLVGPRGGARKAEEGPVEIRVRFVDPTPDMELEA